MPGLPRLHVDPEQVVTVPASVMSAVRGGEKVAQWTSGGAMSVQLWVPHAMLPVGDWTTPPLAVCMGDATTTVAAPVASSRAQAGGGRMAGGLI